ncbi:MAG: hypothetical protein E7Z89_00800 [Cyanobacteria bacterium SIG28]|nr:hypothetical protein [Cyanobacteria bacterium SIG28]
MRILKTDCCNSNNLNCINSFGANNKAKPINNSLKKNTGAQDKITATIKNNKFTNSKIFKTSLKYYLIGLATPIPFGSTAGLLIGLGLALRDVWKERFKDKKEPPIRS